MEDSLIDKIEESFDIEKLKSIINDLSVSAWDSKMGHAHLENWLKNFNGRILKNENVEKIIAMWLLLNFTFYTEKEVRALCKCIYEDYIHNKLLYYEQLNFMENSSIKDKIQHIIEFTLFVPLGNPSESGTNILYYFRQENKLSKKSFEPENKKKYENTVYIDDITISGTQASGYIKNKNYNSENNFILTFIATDDALIEFSKKHPDVQLIYSILLDDRSKCFVSDSFVFSGIKSKLLISPAKEMCEGYGKLICPSAPLGYDDGQFLFGFYYNTPDNTLPVIWFKAKNWFPAFLRYPKKCGKDEVDINEAKYF